MDHAFRGESLTRRAVLRLMAAAAARPAPASASPAPLARPIPSSGETIPAVRLGTLRTFDVGPLPTHAPSHAARLEGGGARPLRRRHALHLERVRRAGAGAPQRAAGLRAGQLLAGRARGRAPHPAPGP